MSFQAYLDNIKAKTGKSPDDFRVLAVKKGLAKSGEIVTWLKDEFGLGHGHARAIASLLVHSDKVASSPKDKFDALFTGKKSRWRSAFNNLTAQIEKFGTDIEVAPNQTYFNVLRGKKFAILQPSTAERFDIGLKLKSVAPSDRLEAAGSWNNMVTHRIHRHLLLSLEFATKLFVLALKSLVSAQEIDRRMLRGGHEPCSRVIGDTGLRPLLERGNKSILCELLGQTGIAHDPRETGDDRGRLNPPDCVNRTMCIGSRHDYLSH